MRRTQAPRALLFALLAIPLALGAPRATIAAEPEGDVPWQPEYATSKQAPEIPLRTQVAGKVPTLFSRFDWTASNCNVAGVEPPDPHFAAGPAQVIGVNNEQMSIYTKNGTILACTRFENFFTSTVGQVVDPKVVYDPGAQRFYVAAFSYNNTTKLSTMHLAVSKTSEPTTATSTSWWLYSLDAREIVGSTTYGADYTCLGFDQQAVYVAFNMFSLPFTAPVFYNCQINALDKTPLLSGTATNHRVYTTPGSSNGFTLQPVSVFSASGPTNKGYFVEIPTSSTTQVRLFALSNPLGVSPTLTSTMVTVPNHGGPITGAPQLGTTRRVDTMAPRAQNNALYYGGKVWFAHTAGGPALGRAVVFYYAINANDYPAASPTLAESGGLDGGAGVWTYQPALGCNTVGDLCLAYTQSSANQYPEIRAVARKLADTGFSSSISVRLSNNYYKGKGADGATQRWGDYAGVAGDPVDHSFWVSHEYAKDLVNPNGGWQQVYANLQVAPDIAGWQPNGIPLRAHPSDAVLPAVAPDGSGGAFAAWLDTRVALDGAEVYMTHVGSNGVPDPAWPHGGLRVTNDSWLQSAVALYPDGVGGVYALCSGGGSGVRVQRRTSTGAVVAGWPTDGRQISATGTSPAALVDASGNVLVAWRQSGIKAQKVNSAGVLQWASAGVTVSTNTSGTALDVTTDGAGGAIVSWSQPTNSVRAQRVSSAGAVMWASGGVALDTGIAPRILTDGAGGAFLAFRRTNASPALADLYATRVSSAGTVVSGWPRTVCNANQDQTDPRIATDEGSGFVVGWLDRRADPGNGVGDIYAQRFDAAGNALWGANGLAVCTTPDDQYLPVVTSDGAGGALLAWADSRGDGDIYAQRVRANGSVDPTFPANGFGLCVATDLQEAPALALVSKEGTAIAAWQDGRTYPDCTPTCSNSIYAGLLTYDPLAPDAVTDLAMIAGRHSLAIAWTEPADQPGGGPIAAYDLRYSNTPITSANFDGAFPITVGPAGAPGTPMCVEMSGLNPCTSFYAAIKSYDALGNVSSISNLPSAQTLCSGNSEVVCSNGGRAVDAGDPGRAPDRLVLARPQPNPTSGTCEISFGVPGALGRVAYDVGIYDVAGRRTRLLATGLARSGWTKLTWDLRDDEGRPVNAGAYFVRVNVGPDRRTERLVVNR